MAWFKMIPEDRVENELKDLYDKLSEPSGVVNNMLSIHIINTSTLKGHYEFYSLGMKGRKDLFRKRRKMITVVVSIVNHFYDLIVHHGVGLRKITCDIEFFDKFTKDYMNIDIS
jgi:hypothetical protein